MLAGQLIEAPEGLLGFDANSFIGPSTAALFRSKGYRFAIRYVPRHKPNPNDLSMSEAAGILSSGLGLMIVQHVIAPLEDGTGWVASGALGTEYGAFAAKSCREIGLPEGVNVWCDLEGVRAHTDPRDVIAFCNNWHAEVGTAGYTPGLYVGYGPGLTADQLYRKLRFEHYWSAYNLNSDQIPAVRGVQMKQAKEQRMGVLRFDPNTIQRDNVGGLPLMLVDSEWSAE